MRIQLAVVFAAMALTAQSAVAQRPREGDKRTQERPRQHPQPPPAPVRRRPTARPDIEHRRDGRNDDRPHVIGRRWYGHATPSDARFHLSHPYEHGRFVRLGPSFRYHPVRFDRARRMFWLPGGAYFEIAPWDFDVASDWCWDCSDDDFVVYRDPDHIGWYLVYDSRTGAYIHAQYMGQ